MSSMAQLLGRVDTPVSVYLVPFAYRTLVI